MTIPKDVGGGPAYQPILAQCIAEGLQSILGESGSQMVLRLHSIQSLSNDADTFHAAMAAIFREEGARVLEREVGARLLERMPAGGRGGFLGRRRRQKPLGATRSGVSSAERDLLKRFLSVAFEESSPTVDPIPVGFGRGSIAMTSLRFAAAFKK